MKRTAEWRYSSTYSYGTVWTWLVSWEDPRAGVDMGAWKKTIAAPARDQTTVVQTVA